MSIYHLLLQKVPTSPKISARKRFDPLSYFDKPISAVNGKAETEKCWSTLHTVKIHRVVSYILKSQCLMKLQSFKFKVTLYSYMLSTNNILMIILIL